MSKWLPVGGFFSPLDSLLLLSAEKGVKTEPFTHFLVYSFTPRREKD